MTWRSTVLHLQGPFYTAITVALVRCSKILKAAFAWKFSAKADRAQQIRGTIPGFEWPIEREQMLPAIRRQISVCAVSASGSSNHLDHSLFCSKPSLRTLDAVFYHAFILCRLTPVEPATSTVCNWMPAGAFAERQSGVSQNPTAAFVSTV